MGVVQVPSDAYYGPQTRRAVDNFTISGLQFPPEFIQHLVRVKKHAAVMNTDLGLLAGKCISGIQADRIHCREYMDQSLALATMLVPHVGYDQAAKVAEKAHATGQTIRDVVAADNLLPSDAVKRLFDPSSAV